MTELEKWQLVNSCETGEALAEVIRRFANEAGRIQGRVRDFSAEDMANSVDMVLSLNCPPNVLTREYGIRQQCLYLLHYNKPRLNFNQHSTLN